MVFLSRDVLGFAVGRLVEDLAAAFFGAFAAAFVGVFAEALAVFKTVGVRSAIEDFPASAPAPPFGFAMAALPVDAGFTGAAAVLPAAALVPRRATAALAGAALAGFPAPFAFGSVLDVVSGLALLARVGALFAVPEARGARFAMRRGAP